VWKEIIRPGTYWYIDQETQKPKRLVATPADIRHWHDNGNKMLSSGLSVPIPLEHDLDCRPMTAAERAAKQLLNNTGFTKKYAIRPGDRLFGLLDIENPDVYAKLPTTIKYTSPWINSFTDSENRTWNNVISHVALTSRPRITQQEPFGPAAAALSLAVDVTRLEGGTPVALPARGIVLSLAGLLDADITGKLSPHRPKSFAVWAGAKFAEEPPFEKKEKTPEKGDKPPEKKEGGKGEKIETEIEEGELDELTMIDVLRDLVCALWGVELPEDTTPEKLQDDLMRALMANLKGETTMPDETPQTPQAGAANNPGQQQKPPVVQESPQAMYMSLEKIAAITDPLQKEMAQMLFSMQQDAKKKSELLDSLTKGVLDAAKARRDQRISNLARRLPAMARDKILAQASAANAALSLGDGGVVIDPMSSTLDMLESAVMDLPSLLLDPQGIQAQAHPQEPGGPMSEERLKQVQAEFSNSTGFKFEDKKSA
jgi:hypothetical protein